MGYAWLAGTEFGEEREKSRKPVQPTGYREATGRVGDDRAPTSLRDVPNANR
jgi:hypothetical protein